MKKKVILALAAITALSSIKVLALTDEEEAYLENQRGKIEATQAAEEEAQQEEIEDFQGKTTATELNSMIYEIEDLAEELQQLISSMGEAGYGLQANSLGQYDSRIQALEDDVRAQPNSRKVITKAHKEALEIKAELKAIADRQAQK